MHYQQQPNQPIIDCNKLHPGSNNHSGQAGAVDPHSRITILCIKEADGELLIDLNRYQVIHDNIFLLTAGQLYQLGEGSRVKGHVISFSTSLADCAALTASFSTCNRNCGYQYYKVCVQDSREKAEFRDIVNAIAEEINGLRPFSQAASHALLKIIIILIARNCKGIKTQQGIDNDAMLAKKFNQLLHQKGVTRKSVCNYAGELSVSPNYLNQVVKRCSGYTASHHIQQHIVTEAKRKAVYSGVTMKQIAYSLGFDDMAHFSKYFKKNAGTTFSEFATNANTVDIFHTSYAPNS